MSGAGATIVGLVLVLVLGAAAQTFRFPGDSSADVEGDSDYDDNGDGEVPGELEMETEIDVRDAKHLRSIHIYPDDRVQILESGRSISTISFLCASSLKRYEDERKASVGSTFYISLSCITQNELDESTKAQSSSSGMLRIPQCSLRPAHCQP